MIYLIAVHISSENETMQTHRWRTPQSSYANITTHSMEPADIRNLKAIRSK